jgi:hypothetical protein
MLCPCCERAARHFRTAVLIFSLLLGALHAQSTSSRVPNSGSAEPDQGRPHDSNIEPLRTFPIPRPLFSVGVSLTGGGYRPMALLAKVGFDQEGSNFFANASAAYDNDRMTNDADQPNPKGHDRYLNGGVYFRPPWQPFHGAWFVGAGERCSQLSTTNYTKTGNRPQIGGAYDLIQRPCPNCEHGFSMRITLNWIAAGNDWQNGTHGTGIGLSFPTPRQKRHWFWEESIDIYRSHETVTEPSNLPLTRSQRATRIFWGRVDFGVVYRL